MFSFSVTFVHKIKKFIQVSFGSIYRTKALIFTILHLRDDQHKNNNIIPLACTQLKCKNTKIDLVNHIIIK